MTDSSQAVPGWVPEGQVGQIVQEAIAAYVASQPQQASGSVSADDMKRTVEEALARQAEAHSKQIETLMQSMRGNVVTLTPHNSGGPGSELAETWSYAEQTAAHAADEAARKASAAA